MQDILRLIFSSKRVVAYAGTLAFLGVLLVVAWFVGPPAVDAEAQRAVANALGTAASVGLPVLIGGISATDWKEAKTS